MILIKEEENRTIIEKYWFWKTVAMKRSVIEWTQKKNQITKIS